MSQAKAFGICFGLTLAAFAAVGHQKSKPASEPSMQTLTIREQPNQVVLAWSGPIEATMRDALVAAVNKFKADPRRMVIALNSPGGSIASGREVMAAIREASQTREIDTFIDKGAVCASMCVPVYLLGSKRMAAPGAHFMFHEASLNMAALKAARHGGASLDPTMIKVVEIAATDRLFDSDLQGRGVNTNWLASVRSRVSGRDIWISGRQLVDQGSGVIDTLID